MFERRTDLALEVHELQGEDSGIVLEESEKSFVHITTASVISEEGEKNAGKPIGKYITLDIGRIWQTDRRRFEAVTQVLADEITALLPEGDGCVLTVGLGNEEITPDSIGPRAVKRLIVTRHIESADPMLFSSVGFGSVASICTGVLGQTGIESAEIIKSVCERIKPKCVILIDALASRRLARLATTIQLSDTGISPGSGVQNRRASITEEYVGCPVISIGVPTVVDAATLAYDLLEENLGDDIGLDLEKAISSIDKSMFVTPKDNDIIAKETASLIASALNLALHGLEINDQAEFLH